jgi:eukaryotic-like serine/threonine-protein kinase
VELRAGARLDRYTLVAPLGEGGQAAVWKVIDPLEGGAVRALKIFQLRGANPENADRARREAKAGARAQHPGILPCRTLIEDPENELLALVFDYVRGRSLADAIADPRMVPELRRAAVRQLADTLAYVHGRNIVHRDVKPDNVLVTDAFWESPAVAGTLKLVDFGIATPAGNPKPLTREGGVVGTAPYLAPELADSSGLFEVGSDFQRDVFAFGVLAWEVLVGGHPTGLPLGASRDAFAGVYLGARAGKRGWPPEAPGIAELEVVRACLSLSASGRPESCIVVADALGTGLLESGRPRTSEPVASGMRTSQTEVHVPPRTLPVSEGWRPPPSAGQAGPSSGAVPPRGAASPAPEGAYPGAEVPRARRAPDRHGMLLWAGLVGALLAAGTIGTVVYLLRSPPEPERQQVISFGNTPAAAAPAEAPARATTQVACCTDDAGTCKSGRICQRPPCGETLDEADWQLRVVGGFLRSGGNAIEIQREWKSSSICVKNTRTGEERCASSNQMWSKGYDAGNRVPAKTSDLVNGNLEVRVVDRGIVRQSPIRAFGSPIGYKTTALCSKVILHLGRASPDDGQIAVFLDAP